MQTDRLVLSQQASAQNGPGVLTNRALCLCSFCVTFSEPNSSFQMECSTKCALLMQCYTVQVVSGRLTGQKSWNQSCTQNPLESTSGPVIHGKPLRHRTLQLSTSRLGTRPSAERPEFTFSLGQDTQAKRRTTPCPASDSCQWTSVKFRQFFDVVAMTTRRYSVGLGNAPPSKSPHWSVLSWEDKSAMRGCG